MSSHATVNAWVALLALALAALAAKPAAANTAIAPVFLSLPGVCFLLLLVIPLEGLVASRVLRMGYESGVLLALRANLVSTALGTALAFALSLALQGTSGLTPLIMLALLIPNFFLTVGCEYLVARRAAPEQPAARWAWSANALSYSLLGLLFAVVLRQDAVASRSLVWSYTCRSNLKRINGVLDIYRRDHDGRLPPAQDFSSLARQVAKSLPAEHLRCPATRRAYFFNATLSGTRVARIAARDETPLLLDAVPHPDDRFCVLFASGSARALPAGAYRTLEGHFK
jgi:hypothetical protein